MDIESFLRDPVSRKRFFSLSGVGLAGGSAVFLSGCTDDTQTAPTGPDESDDADVEILNAALDLELMSIAAYKMGAGKLRGDALALGKLFLEHEQEHADGLSVAIKEMSGRPNRAKSSYDFPQLRSQQDVLRFAVDLERTAIASYIDALPKLSPGDLRATAASIITTEAEHVAVLLDALGDDPAPEAFVTGKTA